MTSRVCKAWTISANMMAWSMEMPNCINTTLTAKCQGPAPLGVGTSTAMVIMQKESSPA